MQPEYINEYWEEYKKATGEKSPEWILHITFYEYVNLKQKHNIVL